MVTLGPIVILAALIVIAAVVAVVTSVTKSSGDGAPRGFPWLAMLVGIVVVGGIVTFLISRARPSTFVLAVNVPSGKPFLGEVIIDGRREVIQGEGGGHFEYPGRVIQWQVLIDDEAAGTDSISAHLAGAVNGSSSSSWGVSGFAEQQFLGGGGRSFSTLGEQEYRILMDRLRPPTEAADPILPGFSAPSNTTSEEDAGAEPSQNDGDPDAEPDTAEDATLMSSSKSEMPFELALSRD